MEVLALDCQATGSFPRGELLEIGWARSTAAATNPPSIEAHVIAPRSGGHLTRRIRQLTGFSQRDLRTAASRARVGGRLAEVVRGANGAHHGPAVAVAHFARFEEPFLRDLLSAAGPLPFELVCTHEIARRLFPGLPRRGLRAVAGYLGHGVPELRRAGSHVAATLAIWRGLVPLLKAEHGIRTLEELRSWLGSSPPSRGRRAYPMDPRLRLDLPAAPGIYRFQRTDGSVLYVGKATSLRQRVNTYFQTSRGHKDRTLEMLAQARAVDVTPTASALEAALLEPDEIKRLTPPYNVALRVGERRLAFFSWSLRHAAPRPDRCHTIGPLLLQGPRPPLAALLEILDDGGGARTVERLHPTVLGIPRRYAPTVTGFRKGLALFVERHGRWWEGRAPVRALSSLAGRLRARRPTDEPLDAESESTDLLPETDRWTPDSVAQLLEEVVLRGAYVIRRSRWLLALSECAVSWPSGGSQRRCVVFRGGAMAAGHDLEEGRWPPLPPGHATPRFERQRSTDLPAYDRLSVLSRELKVLAAGGAPVMVRLGPDRVLERDALDRAVRCL